MKKSVRMADIAQQLGISTVSVSKALAGKPGVSEEMRTKVIAAAHQMGYSGVRVRYEPGLTGNIGVLVSDRLFSENTFYTDLYRELVLCSGADGFSCIMEIVSQDAEQAAEPPALVMRQRVDGVIFLGPLRSAYLEAVMTVGLPSLALDFRIPGLRMDSVLRDNAEGGFLLTKHLLSAGYKQIGFAGNIDGSDNVMERYLGYQWALRQAGIVPCDAWLWRDFPASGFSGGRPEAFVCSSNEIAVHLLDAWQRDTCPDATEITAVCFDDCRVSARFNSQLTIYQVDTKQMAETAVCQILRRIRREDLYAGSFVISGQVVAT